MYYGNGGAVKTRPPRSNVRPRLFSGAGNAARQKLYRYVKP